MKCPMIFQDLGISRCITYLSTIKEEKASFLAVLLFFIQTVRMPKLALCIKTARSEHLPVYLGVGAHSWLLLSLPASQECSQIP